MPARQLWSWGTPASSSSNQRTCGELAWPGHTSRPCRAPVADVVQRQGGISLIVRASQRCSMVVSVWAMFMAHGVGVLARMVKGRGRRSKWHAGRRPSSAGHRGSVSPDQLVARISPGEAADNHALRLASGSAGTGRSKPLAESNRPLTKNPARGNPQTGVLNLDVSINTPRNLGGTGMSRESLSRRNPGASPKPRGSC
jgi:hypothetical protein